MDTHPEKRQYIYRPLWLRRLPGFTIALTCAVCRQPHRLHTHTHAPSFFAREVSGMDIRIAVPLSWVVGFKPSFACVPLEGFSAPGGCFFRLCRACTYPFTVPFGLLAMRLAPQAVFIPSSATAMPSTE